MAFSSSTENLQLGPAKIAWGAVSSEANLGFTEGGIELSIATDTQDLVTDQYGTTPIKRIITGRKIGLKTPMAEYSLDLLRLLLPGSSLVTDDVDATKKKLIVTSAAGTDLLTLANSLLLKKADSNVETTNKKYWVRFVKAVPSGSLTVSWSKTAQQIFNVDWVTFPYSATDGTIVIFGDETASGAAV